MSFLSCEWKVGSCSDVLILIAIFLILIACDRGRSYAALSGKVGYGENFVTVHFHCYTGNTQQTTTRSPGTSKSPDLNQ